MIRWLAAFAVLTGALYFGKKFFFPDDRDLIRGRLDEIAGLLTKSKGESVLAAARKISDALEYFHAPVTVTVNSDVLTERTVTEQDKTRLKESLAGLKLRYGWVNVSFKNVHIEVRGGEASVAAVARLEFETGEQGLVYDLYALFMDWRKIGGTWFIEKIDVSRTKG